MIDANLLVGRTLAAKYQLQRLIGQGGMGMVFEGRNLELGKRVAIKLIDTTDTQATELAARLRREARAASSVESDAIVQVFDVGDDPDVGVFMVMEFLVGEDLAARIRREQHVDVGTCVTIAYSVARALARAHGAGVIHRDLKPANIFLSVREDGSLQVKILDFGISKIVEDDKKSHTAGLTRMGTAIGTPHYMSPEQAQGLPDIDGRTDVWALGGVMYEMLTGASAYPELATYEQTIVRILTTRPKPILEAAPWVPPAVAAVIDAALEHDLERRIPDAASFSRMLGDLGAGARAGSSGSFAALSGPTGALLVGPSSVAISPLGVPPEPLDLKSTLPLTSDLAAAYRHAPPIVGAGAPPPGTALGLGAPSPASSPGSGLLRTLPYDDAPRPPAARSTSGAAISLEPSQPAPFDAPAEGGRASSGAIWKIALALVLVGGGAAAFVVVRGGAFGDPRSAAGSVSAAEASAGPGKRADAKPLSTEEPSAEPSRKVEPTPSSRASATSPTTTRPTATGTTTRPTPTATGPTARPTSTVSGKPSAKPSAAPTTAPTEAPTAPPTSTGIPTGGISTAYPE